MISIVDGIVFTLLLLMVIVLLIFPLYWIIIDSYSFSDCPSLREIHYNGTKQEWRKIKKHGTWKNASPIETIHCVDGDINYKVV